MHLVKLIWLLHCNTVSILLYYIVLLSLVPVHLIHFLTMVRLLRCLLYAAQRIAKVISTLSWLVSWVSFLPSSPLLFLVPYSARFETNQLCKINIGLSIFCYHLHNILLDIY